MPYHIIAARWPRKPVHDRFIHTHPKPTKEPPQVSTNLDRLATALFPSVPHLMHNLPSGFKYTMSSDELRAAVNKASVLGAKAPLTIDDIAMVLYSSVDARSQTLPYANLPETFRENLRGAVKCVIALGKILDDQEAAKVLSTGGQPLK